MNRNFFLNHQNVCLSAKLVTHIFVQPQKRSAISEQKFDVALTFAKMSSRKLVGRPQPFSGNHKLLKDKDNHKKVRFNTNILGNHNNLRSMTNNFLFQPQGFLPNHKELEVNQTIY